MAVNKKTDNWTPCETGPDWEEAPPWANWIIHSFDGNWYWVENHPHDMNRGKVKVWERKK